MSGGTEPRLRRWGDTTLLLWSLGLLAGGALGVWLWHLSWREMLLLDAGLFAAGLALAAALSRLIERRSVPTLFLWPSVRQLLVLVLPVAVVAQAWLIQVRPLSAEEIEERLHALEQGAAGNPEREAEVAIRRTIVEAGQREKERASSAERRRIDDVTRDAVDPDAPLPPPGPAATPPAPGPETAPSPGGTATPEGSPAATPGSSPGSSPPPGGAPRPPERSFLEHLLSVVTGPFRALLGALFNLGGSEEYRQLAARVVVDLSQGKEPTPATLTQLLSHLDPAEQKRALDLLRRFISGQRELPPDVQRQLKEAVGKAVPAGSAAESSETFERLRELLAQGEKDCEVIAGSILREGSFTSQADKDEILRELAAARLEDCRERFGDVPIRTQQEGE